MKWWERDASWWELTAATAALWLIMWCIAN